MAAEEEADPTMTLPPSIQITNLTYTFPNTTTDTGLHNITLSLPPRSRTLLLGANGAGKTTLLRLLSGSRLAPRSTISISGSDPFTSHPLGVTYLGLEWVLNPIVRSDIGVRELLSSVGGDAYPSRRDELVAVLDIDVEWRLHAVSDGERRRVQLAMGLVRPWRVLCLDEVTVDLDLLSRSGFLGFLKRETESRECLVVYATHVLDGLAGWPTHLVHLTQGRVKEWGEVGEFELDGGGEKGTTTGNSVLGELVLKWLREDLKERGPRNGKGGEGRTYAMDGIGGYGLEQKN